MRVPHFKDLTGKKLGRWTVRAEAAKRGHRTVWSCVCECGAEKDVEATHLNSGKSLSCGCLARETTSRVKRRHGYSTHDPMGEYNIWSNMKARCNKPGHISYKWYGAKGVRVCERWEKSFEDFIADVGRRPSKDHSIDRIDASGHYEPGNCRWSTEKQQQRNKRNNRLVEINGEVMCLAEAAERFGVNPYTVAWRTDKRGKSIEEALK